MPHRILRESILDSEAVNSLTPQAEVFYRRLMSAVDDFGRFDARPAVLRCRLYPLQLDRVGEQNIRDWLAECERAGLVTTYAVGGKPYLLFHKLGPQRAKTSKYPAPAGGASPADPRAHAPASANGCAHVRADECGRAQAPAHVTYSYSDSYSDAEDSSEPAPPSAEPAAAPAPETPPAGGDRAVLTFPTVGKGPKTWELTEAKVREYAESFPGVDVLGECRKAVQWARDNPRKRKTARGMPAFLARWLGKAQDHGTNARAGARPPATATAGGPDDEVETGPQSEEWVRRNLGLEPTPGGQT